MTDGRQPFLHDAVVALRAPTQAWSRASGEMSAAIDGLYHGDRRFLSAVSLTVGGEAPETIAHAVVGAGEVVFDAVLRGVDDPTPDPHVRLTRTRIVTDGRMSETIAVSSVVAAPVTTRLSVRLVPDFRSLGEVKSGRGGARGWRAEPLDGGVRITADDVSLAVSAPGASPAVADGGVTLSWELTVPSGSSLSVSWEAVVTDPALVVGGASSAVDWAVDAAGLDPRVGRWLRVALDDLDALRLALPDRPDDVFLAAGAPWFFTLFGRDSLWAARMMLPVDVGLAASTLRVLARLQGTRDDPETEEEPGRIPHELRAGEFSMPGEGIVLPPLYYGTVDATALWVCLLVDAWRAGMPVDEVRALLPSLRAALGWITRGDGFLSYVDRTGRGLANQGWKDSGDSIQWRDGTLAEGPIALCEVQGYAYEAVVGAVALLEGLGEDPGRLSEWASALRSRFADAFWVTTSEGRYPAIALDRHGRAVDTLTSNIGHLLGTGLLSPDEESAIAELLVGPSMSSGFGLRTMSTDAAGYWPLGYHRGAVWAHDTAIVAHGMARAGSMDAAGVLVEGLLAAAEGFDYRMPELHSGDARFARGGDARFARGGDARFARGGDARFARGGDARFARGGAPVPYPAACRPQAWSAAAAVTCAGILRAAAAAG